MSIVTALKISLSYLEKQIFHEIGIQVEPGDRIGLVGPNGSGKTTLLKLLMGEISPDAGEIRVTKGSRVCYLPQDVQETSAGPLLQSVIDSIPGRVKLKKELKKVGQALDGARQEEEQAGQAEKLAEIHQELNHLELRYPSHEAQEILTGLKAPFLP
jgi:ATP-binding cassette subfamily F protein 3